MKKRIQLLALSFRGIWGMYCIPVLVVLLVAPTVSFLFISQYGAEPSLPAIASYFQIAIPIFPVCWLMGTLREYIEGDGNEVLFIYQQAGRTRILEVIILIAWYIFHIGLFFMFLAKYYPLARLEGLFLRVVIQSVFFSSCFYMLAYLIRSISMTLLAILSYYFMTAFYAQDSILSAVSVFQFPNDLEISPVNVMDYSVMAIAVIFLAIGFVLNGRETS